MAVNGCEDEELTNDDNAQPMPHANSEFSWEEGEFMETETSCVAHVYEYQQVQMETRACCECDDDAFDVLCQAFREINVPWCEIHTRPGKLRASMTEANTKRSRQPRAQSPPAVGNLEETRRQSRKWRSRRSPFAAPGKYHPVPFSTSHASRLASLCLDDDVSLHVRRMVVQRFTEELPELERVEVQSRVRGETEKNSAGTSSVDVVSSACWARV